MFLKLYEKMSNIDDIKKYRFFVTRTNRHIELVKNAANKIADTYPEFEALRQQSQNHDASKFEDPEINPYIELTWNKNHENRPPTKEENAATLHHIKNNSHHPEFHLVDKSKANISSTDRDKSDKIVDVSLMPDLDVAEMVADWQAMSEELHKNTAREWFDNVKKTRWHFSQHQQELIDKLLRVFENGSSNS